MASDGKATKATRVTKGGSRSKGAPPDKKQAASSLRAERRSRQQDLGRTQLLDAAEDVFAEKGFHDASLKDIAERAEFSVGSVYSFFENKDDLFMSVFLRRGDELVPAIRGAVTGPGTPLEQLHHLIDVEIGFFRAHAQFGRLFLRTSSATVLSPERAVDEAMRSRFSEAMQLQAAMFERGQKAGVFRAGDPVVLARLFSGLISGYQATDPAVVGDDAELPPARPAATGERLALADFHDLVEAAFRA